MAQATQETIKIWKNSDEIWTLAFRCKKVGKSAYTVILVQGTVSYIACTNLRKS